LEGFLDSCGCNDGFWNLCSICHAALLRGSFPKFSGKNNMNVTLCQYYPAALKDLTLAEEYLIAMSHPVRVVVELRPGGTNVASKLPCTTRPFYRHTTGPKTSTSNIAES
jgi:hypothetical protein